MNEVDAVQSCIYDLGIFYHFGRLEDPKSSPEQALENVFKLTLNAS